MLSAADATADVLQAQLDELEALAACFPDELKYAPPEADNLRFAQLVAAGQSSAAAAADVPALSGTIELPGIELAGAPVRLAFVLPKHGGAAGLRVQTSAPRHEADLLQQLASTTAAECARDGMPCLLVAAQSLAEAAGQLAEAEAQAAERRQREGEQPPAAPGGGGSRRAQQEAARQLVLSRRCIWFHHVKSTTKRKCILGWGGDLRLGGYSKPGFPGIVLVEGAGCDIDEYLTRLRRLRWQAMAVRGEEDLPMGSLQELGAARKLPCRMQEMGEEDMGRLAAACREAGLEDIFLTALKLQK